MTCWPPSNETVVLYLKGMVRAIGFTISLQPLPFRIVLRSDCSPKIWTSRARLGCQRACGEQDRNFDLNVCIPLLLMNGVIEREGSVARFAQ